MTIDSNVSAHEKAVDFYKQLISELISFTTEAVIFFRENGFIFDCNTSACEMFGFPKEEMLKMNIITLTDIHPEDFRDLGERKIGHEINIISKGSHFFCKKNDGEKFVAQASLHAHRERNSVIFLLSLKKSGVIEVISSEILKTSTSPTCHVSAANSVVAVLEVKDVDLVGHSRRVGSMMKSIGQILGKNEDECILLDIAGKLHDVGKLIIPEEILRKQETLSFQERSLIQRHPEQGAQILALVRCCDVVIDQVLCHHERYDGSGYPHGLRGHEISLGSQIVAVVDTFDAMTSKRPYHPPKSKKVAMSFIKENRGKLYSPEVVDAFLEFQNRVRLVS